MTASSITLSERLAALKEKTKPVPLSLFLHIYSKASTECYIDYMHGAKALLKWLGKIEYPVKQYPEILNPKFKVPGLLSGYESNELAKLLEPYEKYNNMDEYLRAYTIARNSIYFIMSKEIINELY